MKAPRGVTPADLTACPKCAASMRSTWNACPACGAWLADRPRPLERWADIGVSPVIEDAIEDRRLRQAVRERELRLGDDPDPSAS